MTTNPHAEFLRQEYGPVQPNGCGAHELAAADEIDRLTAMVAALQADLAEQLPMRDADAATIWRLTAALAEAEAAIADARMDGIEDMRQRCVQFCIDRAKRHTSTERGLAVLEIADQLQDV